MMNKDCFIDAMAELDADLLTEHFERKCPTKAQKLRKYAMAVAAYAAACLVIALIIPFVIGRGEQPLPPAGKEPVANTEVESSEPDDIPPGFEYDDVTNGTTVFLGCEFTITLDKESYTLDDTITATVTLTNNGDKAVGLWQGYLGNFLDEVEFFEDGELRLSYSSDWDRGYDEAIQYGPLEPGESITHTVQFTPGAPNDTSDPVASTESLWEITASVQYYEYVEDYEGDVYELVETATVTIEVPHEVREPDKTEPEIITDLPTEAPITTEPPETEPPVVIPPLEEGQSISGDFIVKDTAAVKYIGSGGDVVIPEGIEFLGNGIFDDCYTITSITFPASLHGQALDGGPERDTLDDMVAHIPTLTHYYFADGNPKYYSYDGLILTSYGDGKTYIERVPPGRTEITVPSFVNYGVNGGQNLKNIYVENGHPTFSSYDGILFSKDMTELCKLPLKKTVFSMPPEFTQSTFFWHDVCKNIERYEVDPANKKYCSIDGVLYEKKGDKVLLVHVPYNKTSYTFPNNCYDAWKNPFYGNTGIREIVVPLHFKVDYSAWNMFAGCRNLESVTIHQFADTADSMFLGCSSLKSIYLPEIINVIRSGCFFGCSSLQTVTIPSTVTRIESSAFANCTSLVDVYIPDSVTEIDKNAFGSRADGSMPQNLVIHCSAGSYAAKYAAENGISWTAN